MTALIRRCDPFAELGDCLDALPQMDVAARVPMGRWVNWSMGCAPAALSDIMSVSFLFPGGTCWIMLDHCLRRNGRMCCREDISKAWDEKHDDMSNLQSKNILVHPDPTLRHTEE